MANTAQALPAADAGQVADGFTDEERAQFAEMEKDTSEPSPTPEPAPTPAPQPAPIAADGDDDEDEEEAAAEPAGGAAPASGDPGAPPVAGAPGEPAAPGTVVPKRRVSARKYERAEEARKVAETERDTLRQNQARLDERMRIINEALTAPAQPVKTAAEEDAEPDAEKDVFAWIAWKKRDDVRVREEIAELRTGRQAEVEDTTLANTYTEDARSFAATEPNFVPAYQFLMANRTYELAQYFFGKDLTEQGVQLTTEELGKIRGTIGNEEKQLASEAITMKQSPAKRVFALAKARGYRPAAAAPAAKTNGAAAPAAAAPGGLAASAAAPSVVAEIANIKAGSEAARSLSTGGAAPPNPLTPEKLANMSDEEFGALVDGLSPTETKELFGT
jgi:hypothetical protein